MFDYGEDVCVFFTKIVAYYVKEIISTAKKFIEQVPWIKIDNSKK